MRFINMSKNSGQSKKTGKLRKIQVYWDADGEHSNYPDEKVEIPSDIDDEDVADYLSDKFGWCVSGWHEGWSNN